MKTKKLIITLAIFFGYTVAYAQIKKDSSATIKQSALSKAESIIIHDISQAANIQGSSKDISEKLEFDLVDFSPGTTFIVNGKPLKEPKSIEYILSTEKKRLKSVYVSRYNEAGQRTVELTYGRP